MNSRPTLIVLLWLVSCVVAMNATAQTYVSLQSSSSPDGGYELYGLGAGGSGGGNGGELPSNGVVNIYFQPSNMTSGGAANENEAGVIGISNPIWNTYTEANAQSLKSNLQDELGNFTPVAFSNNAPVVAQCGETADTQSYFTSGTSGFFRGVLRLAAIPAIPARTAMRSATWFRETSMTWCYTPPGTQPMPDRSLQSTAYLKPALGYPVFRRLPLWRVKATSDMTPWRRIPRARFTGYGRRTGTARRMTTGDRSTGYRSKGISLTLS